MKLFDKMTKAVTENPKGTAKKFVIAALCALIGGGAVCGIMLRTQIVEAVSAYQTEEARGAQDKLAHSGSDGAALQSRENHDYQAGPQQQGANTTVTDETTAAPARSDNGRTDVRGSGQLDGEAEHDGHDGIVKGDLEAGGYVDRELHDDGAWHDLAFTEPSVGAKISVVGYGLLCCAFVAVYWLLTAAWLNGAAAAAGMNAAAWTFAGLAGNLAAVAVFLALRGRKQKCSACGRYQSKTIFCRFCGNRMDRKCSVCGIAADVNDVYCGNCGSVLSDGLDKE